MNGSGTFLARWYLWCFAHQFILVYPVYLLMMEDAGLAPAAIAALLVAWTSTAFLLEVPSGALSDRFPRHRVLAAGVAMKAVGFALWWTSGDAPGFLAGFLCWGAGSALASGTREALLFDALTVLGRQADFAAVWGRCRAIMILGGTLALALGGALAENGYDAVLAASAAATFASALLALGFACERAPADADDDADARSSGDGSTARGYFDLLRSGLLEVLGAPVLRAIVVATAATVGIADSYEEFVSLFLHERGAGLTAVGLRFALIYLGFVAGSALAGRLAPARGMAVTRSAMLWAMAGGGLLVVAAVTRDAAALLALAASFFAWGVYDVRLAADLQHAMSGRARATVTSMAAFAQTGTNIATYLLLGLVAQVTDWQTATLTAGLTLAIASAALLLRRSPAAV